MQFLINIGHQFENEIKNKGKDELSVCPSLFE